MNKVTDIIISHNSVISLHVQLHNQLRQLILSGRWPTGARIPSESQFVEHLELSRGTVRLALQQAEIEGLIERIAGRGTFVAYHPAQENTTSRLVALVTNDSDAENHLLILHGAENEVRARGYQVIFSNTHGHQEEVETLKRLKRENVAGVMLWPNVGNPRSHQQRARKYQQFHLPIVLIDRKIDGLECDCVTSDNYNGAFALVQHLVELGHRHIVFLCHHEMQLSTVAARYQAYCDVLRKSSLIALEPWFIGQPGKEIGAVYALRSSVDSKSLELQQIKGHMANAAPRPTAIFAVNDYLAILAMRAMKMLGLCVPDQMSVAGFDDIDLAMHLEVPLTTVAQDSFTIGKRAAQRLIDRLEGRSGPTDCLLIPTQLRVRNSTAAPMRSST